MADEDIVMTPSKKGKATHIKIERKKKLNLDESSVVHEGAGQNKGLVINKQEQADTDDLSKPQLQLGFMCFLVDQKTGTHFVESRRLKFWYAEGTDYYNQVSTAYDFFKELVRPENFPKDYVGFIKKCMKQMQGDKYQLAVKVDLEIMKLDDKDAPQSPGFNKEDLRPQTEIVREKLLNILESAYPNVLAVEDLIRITASDEHIVTAQLEELKTRELVRTLENGGVVRQVLDEKTGKTEVEVVKNMPMMASSDQPTIAIITALYCEKLAVDSMMENKRTYVKYKTEGESNVYTLGYIGGHKIVSTKLPAIGHVRAAQISSGNSTTRLLGGFQNIEHVFIVGVAGGVPHYTDYYKHVRLGDVILSRQDDRGYIYYYCDKILKNKQGDVHYNLKTWAPRDLELQKITEKIEEAQRSNPNLASWERYMLEGEQVLQGQETNFERPPDNTDRLYMDLGEDQVIEVQHPFPPEGAVVREGMPRLHYGVFGAGSRVVRSDATRLDFASRYNISAFDSEFDQVLESIVGNRKDSFMIIRGIADYSDGSKNKKWQSYAALAAATVTKTVIKSIGKSRIDQ
ncbi:hypothetical protein SNE40_008854 [Patella caerulea]|uniref:Winged helix-turn-helix domain-containing protein n=2 Tax=Patella caerulea TaxID=87958 RepID=A0AAN8PP92_PATCE